LIGWDHIRQKKLGTNYFSMRVKEQPQNPILGNVISEANLR
jgi:hypothetical protein